MSGFPSLSALQGQWPARAAAPRSSKLNSVTRAGQRQPGTHTLAHLRGHTYRHLPTTYYRAPGHLNSGKGDGWGGAAVITRPI